MPSGLPGWLSRGNWFRADPDFAQLDRLCRSTAESAHRGTSIQRTGISTAKDRHRHPPPACSAGLATGLEAPPAPASMRERTGIGVTGVVSNPCPMGVRLSGQLEAGLDCIPLSQQKIPYMNKAEKTWTLTTSLALPPGVNSIFQDANFSDRLADRP